MTSLSHGQANTTTQESLESYTSFSTSPLLACVASLYHWLLYSQKFVISAATCNFNSKHTVPGLPTPTFILQLSKSPYATPQILPSKWRTKTDKAVGEAFPLTDTSQGLSPTKDPGEHQTFHKGCVKSSSALLLTTVSGLGISWALVMHQLITGTCSSARNEGWWVRRETHSFSSAPALPQDGALGPFTSSSVFWRLPIVAKSRTSPIPQG